MPDEYGPPLVVRLQPSITAALSTNVRHLKTLADAGRWIPEVGMGATICHWSDRFAGTIIKVASGRDLLLWVREDCVTRTDDRGPSFWQDYAYEPTPHGFVWTFRLTRAGNWRAVEMDPATGRWRAPKGCGRAHLHVGERAAFFDYRL